MVMTFYFASACDEVAVTAMSAATKIDAMYLMRSVMGGLLSDEIVSG